MLRSRLPQLSTAILLWSTALCAGRCSADQPAIAKRLQRCDVTWDTPSKDSLGSMPIGNGDVGLNVWVEEGGDLLFYLAKTDAWSENARLLKLGRVRVKLSPNPLVKGQPFRQRLRLGSGEILIEAGQGPEAVSLRVWVDANHPVAHVDVESKSPVDVQVSLEMWRTTRRELKANERFSAYGLVDSPAPVFAEPDRIVDGRKDGVVWYHRNERSIWADNLKHQALDDLANTAHDPLLRLTFGGAICGTGMLRASSTSLKTAQPVRKCRISVYAHTAQTDLAEGWLTQLKALADRIEAMDGQQRLLAHRRWWADFWNRSWIYADGDAEAESVTRGYALQRFINACAGRGAMPIKFNGSIFTMDAVVQGERFDADYRNWGGPYWFQNTRLPYWSMLAAGDFDLMLPLWRIYSDTLPLAKARTQRYYKHAGAFWPETMYFWGTYVNDNYGWKRQGKPDGLTDNQYIRYHWEGGIELAAMMLDYYAFTRDEPFLRGTLLPVASEVATFYDRHYPRDEQGRIRLSPAQSLETYWDSVNPAPEIAGLRFILPRLLALPVEPTTPEQRQQWQRMLKELPPLPTRQIQGQTALGFAEMPGSKHNAENPELYAVFPFRLYGLDKPELKMALRSFEHRVHKGTGGWQQDAIQAALLGLSEEAGRMVAANFSRKNPECRFPAFWGPNFDWTPDQDHGCAAMIALQRMLLQADDGKIRVLPAWPRRWNVAFKLHAPQGTVVEVEYRDGQLLRCEVTPRERARDVVKEIPGAK
jgi:alpha-L-fucosidase 2